MSDTAAWLIDKIRNGDQVAWQELIDRYEGRLTAFVRARLRDRSSVEDVVQETFLGFLRSLPHFDASRDLESYLFTIAAHKIRDHLRKQGRHPLALIEDLDRSESPREPVAGIRGASSLLASAERLAGEEQRLSAELGKILDQWRSAGDYRRIMCIELLLVAGWPNQKVASHLGITEQQVANYKFQLIERLARRTQNPSSGSNP
jgi:RNA polymerase sigma-70 factor (ECF subfamily)